MLFRSDQREPEAPLPRQVRFGDGRGGLADAIVDLVSTGSTLKANHLLACEHIMDISSRLIVNQAALKLKREWLAPILEAIAGVVDP